MTVYFISKDTSPPYLPHSCTLPQLLQNLTYTEAVKVHVVSNGQEMVPFRRWNMAKFLSWLNQWHSLEALSVHHHIIFHIYSSVICAPMTTFWVLVATMSCVLLVWSLILSNNAKVKYLTRVGQLSWAADVLCSKIMASKPVAIRPDVLNDLARYHQGSVLGRYAASWINFAERGSWLSMLHICIFLL